MSSTLPNNLTARIKALMTDAADEKVRQLAEDVLERARRDAPPSPAPADDPDAGVTLRESGEVRRVKRGIYEISFNTAYAVKQHEDLQLSHPRGGGPKFLERNVQQAALELPAELRGAMVEVTRKSGSFRRVL